MKKSRILMIAAGTAMAMTFAGCGTEKKAAEVTPTPVPTATPTAAPATVTPAPTATPAPRVIGVKTSQSKFIYLTNSLGTDLREIYLKTAGTEDWGKNLIPSESIVQDAEQVQMYYTSDSSSADSAGDADGSGNSSDSALYDMKIVTADGNTYEIYSVETEDMEKASLTLDEESGVAYLRYMSLSAKSEKDTRENSQQTGYGDDDSDDYYEDSSDSDSDDYYYDDSSDDYYYDDSSDDTDDGSYDDTDDGSYDDSYDGSYDDSDDGSYDDSYDGSYDDSDDGSYDDYYDSDDGYVDAGGDGDYDGGVDYMEDDDIPWDYE